MNARLPPSSRDRKHDDSRACAVNSSAVVNDRRMGTLMVVLTVFVFVSSISCTCDVDKER